MLTPKEDRISPEEALEHPLFQDLDMDNLYQQNHPDPDMCDFNACVEEASLLKSFSAASQQRRVVKPVPKSVDAQDKEGNLIAGESEMDAFLSGTIKSIKLGAREETTCTGEGEEEGREQMPRRPDLGKPTFDSPNCAFRVIG